MKNIIINADDFGYDVQRTQGIVQAFRQGLITNTTVMVNMPYFEEACKLAEQEGFKEKVGLHLNIVEGYPLTGKIRKCSTFCDESGQLHGLWRQSIEKICYLSANERNLLEEEIQAQFSLYLDSGFVQKHFDTHGHAHTYYSAWRVIKSFLQKNGYEFSIRIAKNKFEAGRGRNVRNLYKHCMNGVIPQRLKATDYFTNISGIMETAGFIPADASVEIMCHPSLCNGIICNLEDLPLESLQSLNETEWKRIYF